MATIIEELVLGNIDTAELSEQHLIMALGAVPEIKNFEKRRAATIKIVALLDQLHERAS